MYDDYDDYDDYNDYNDYSIKKKKKASKLNLPLIGAGVGIFTILYRATTAPFWVILGLLFWVTTVITSLVNIIIVANTFTLALYTLLCGIPFYMLLVPGLLMVISYEEGRSKLAQNRPELRQMFNSVDLFIPNSIVMSVIMCIVLVIALLTAYAQYEQSSIANLIIWTSITILSPFFTYACARQAAAGVK